MRYKEKNKKKRLRKYRLLMLILPYLVTFIILTPLALIEKSCTLVKIELTVSDVSFNFLRQEGNPLLNDIWVKKARFVHFKKFIIPFVKVEVSNLFDEYNLKPLGWTKAAINGEMTVLPMDSYSSIIFDNILFSELYLERNTFVKLSMLRNKDQVVRIFIDGASTKGKIDIDKTQLIESQYCKFIGLEKQIKEGVNHFRIFNEDQEKINFLSSEKSLHLNLELKNNQKLSAQNIYIENPSFLKKIGQHQMTSIVKPGKLVIKDMADKEIDVETHDFLVIDHTKNIQITRMEFHDDGIELVLIGEVNGLKIGTKENLTSKLPTILEWLYHKQPLILYLNALLLIPATIVAALQFLEKDRKEENGDNQEEKEDNYEKKENNKS